MSSWWSVELEYCAGVWQEDDAAFFAFEAGFGGVQCLEPGKLLAFVNCKEEELSELQSLAKERGLKVLSWGEVAQEDWVSKCKDVLTPVKVGKIRIVPTVEGEIIDGSKVSLNQSLSTEPREHLLPLVVGLGFGSGHHASTSMALELLQRREVQSLRLQRALDLGTGSGVLAIALALLYPSVNVEAVDNDLLAVENARTNIVLNNVGKRVALKEGSFRRDMPHYDLIVANLYGELLCEFEAKMRQHLTVGGLVVLSGIADNLLGEVKDTYVNNGWKLLQANAQDGWNALLLRGGRRIVS